MQKLLTPITGLIIGIAMVIVIAVPGLCAPAVSVKNVIDGLEQRYANKGFSADFEQAALLTALDITEMATGKAWFSHPGKMRWSYETPDRHEIITNGKALWIYRPEEHQVMQGSADAFFTSGAGGAFLSDITRIRQDFEIKLEETGDNFAELLLIPQKKSADLASIRLTVGLPGHNIQVVVTENPYGDTTKFYFTNIRFNDPDPRNFDFTIPADTEVIDMN